ncbi:MAG: discoidin domain-containing protein [Akkermansiaceae bacterium]
MKLRHILIGTALATATCNGAKPGETVYQTGFLSIEEAHKSIELPEGYSLELILSEPYIEEPVACAWDGNGVLYVVEMRTYMQTADATGEQEPRSRISRHEDTNGDGKYDKHSIFIDNILLPRMVLPLDDRVMVHITNTLDLWTYRDTNGDGKADEGVKIYEGGRRGGNMEHQPSGLIWNMDNWLYITYENRRYRFTDEKLVMERIPRGGGQWGIGQDDWGRIYFSTGGGENPAFFFQQPPVYGMLDLPGQTANDFRAVFPIAQIPDVQGGRGRVGSNGGLNRFTGCAGQGVFRGDRLPEDIRGDLFIPEPVGRLIRRAKVERVDAKTILTNATPKSEFIRTRDANFRPLGAETAPDGRMVFIDMHRGIIQQGNWTRKGSYLRGIIDKWGLDKNIGRGRLYRLVHKDFKAGPKPRMLDESTAELVKHLSHPNGWWRDTAQKLIILRKDRDSVVPALVDLALKGKSELGRAHALWTLEGIGAADSKTVASALQDSSALVKVQALRVGEALIGEGDPAVVASLIQLGESRGKPNAEVATQLLNSITISGTDNADLHALADATVQAFPDNDAVKAVVRMGSSVRNQARAAAEARRKNAQLARSMEHGKVIFAQLCYTCHGADGKGTPVPDNPGQTLAPSMVKASRIIGSGNSLVRTILHGLTGPLDGKTYPGLMVPMNSQDDQWVADIATYVRNSFGNKASPITKGFVAAIRKSSGNRTTPWTLKELEALDPPVLVNRKAWKLTASTNAGECKSAIDGNRKSRWSTNTPQRAGQWFQIELPKRSTISEIQLDCSGSDNDYPRGYEVTVSLDGKKWSKALARGTGTNQLTIIGLPLGEAKFLRITQTGSVNGLFWSIHDLQVKGKEL